MKVQILVPINGKIHDFETLSPEMQDEVRNHYTERYKSCIEKILAVEAGRMEAQSNKNVS